MVIEMLYPLYNLLARDCDEEIVLGKTMLGTEIKAFRYGSSNKAIIIEIGCHGDEMRDLPSLAKIANSLHKGPTFYIVISNPDGVEACTEKNCKGININRDFFKQRSSEARCVAKFIKNVKNKHALTRLISIHGSKYSNRIIFMDKSEVFAKAVLARSLKNGLELVGLDEFNKEKEIRVTVGLHKKSSKKIYGTLTEFAESIGIDAIILELYRKDKNYLKNALIVINAAVARMPNILFIGGATGVGKSTVACELGKRLGLQAVGTGILREVLRCYTPQGYETISKSSYVGNKNKIISSFKRQAAYLSEAIDAVVQRSRQKLRGIIVEGNFLVPNKQGISDIHILLTINDEEEHRRRLATRAQQKYLNNFDNIRLIQEYLTKTAHKNNVLVIENKNINETIDKILETFNKTNSEVSKDG